MSEHDREETARSAIGAEAMTLLDAVDDELIDQIGIVAYQSRVLAEQLLQRGVAHEAVVGIVTAQAANHAADVVYNRAPS